MNLVIDSHCHLNYEGLVENLDTVINNAKKNGVYLMNTISTSLSEIENVLKISEKYEEVLCSIGVHPVNTNKAVFESIYDTLLHYSNHPKVIGIGETGLDYSFLSDDNISVDEKKKILLIQKDSFLEHIKVARKGDIPVVIHTRYAEEDTFEVLSENMNIGSFKGVMHCFTGSTTFAFKCLDLGLYISASGIITFKNAAPLRDTFKAIPLERILVETDAPFLSPVPYRNNKVNQPANVVEVVRCLGEIHGKSYEEMAKITTHNFLHLFDKGKVSLKKDAI